MSIRKTYAKTVADTIINNLQKRQIEGYYCDTKEEAKALSLSFIKDQSVVSFGGSMSLEECGILESLRKNTNIRLIDRSTASNSAEIKQMYHDALSSDYYFMSTNAITLDGQLVNIDGNGNRVSALIYGPEHVIIIAGLNKITSNVEEAISRVHNIATPQNCIRLNKKTPCATTGKCTDCLSPDCICNQVVITRRSGIPKRINVILVGEELGY